METKVEPERKPKDEALEAIQAATYSIYPAYPKVERPPSDLPRHRRGDFVESDYPSVYELIVEEGDPNWAGKKSPDVAFGPRDAIEDNGMLITTVEDEDLSLAVRGEAYGFAVEYPLMNDFKGKLPPREEDYLTWLKPHNVNWMKFAPLFRHAASKFGRVDFDGSYPDAAVMPTKAELLNVRNIVKVFYVSHVHSYKGMAEEKELYAAYKLANGFYVCLHRSSGKDVRRAMRICINACDNWRTFLDCSLSQGARRKMSKYQRIIRGSRAAGVSDA
ncbi:MAG TPA: hypothetical protein PKX17_06105 [Candidatus Methanomethylicus sp.]|nr:hypothetical protein [Candidatus Methanomethylicus sp.]